VRLLDYRTQRECLPLTIHSSESFVWLISIQLVTIWRRSSWRCEHLLEKPRSRDSLRPQLHRLLTRS
jgi:hypothetical protein